MVVVVQWWCCWLRDALQSFSQFPRALFHLSDPLHTAKLEFLTPDSLFLCAVGTCRRRCRSAALQSLSIRLSATHHHALPSFSAATPPPLLPSSSSSLSAALRQPSRQLAWQDRSRFVWDRRRPFIISNPQSLRCSAFPAAFASGLCFFDFYPAVPNAL